MQPHDRAGMLSEVERVNWSPSYSYHELSDRKRKQTKPQAYSTVQITGSIRLSTATTVTPSLKRSTLSVTSLGTRRHMLKCPVLYLETD